MKKAKGLVLVLTLLLCALSVSAFANNPATEGMEKVRAERIFNESDKAWQADGNDYNAKGRNDKPEFTSQTEDKIYGMRDKITQEEGKKYNETK